jgi:predicted porin
MKKSLLALAVLGAFAGAASAQSSVTIYGVVDASVSSIDNGADRAVALDDGNNAASRIGFKGVEDLGNGLKAEFLLENGFDVSNGNAKKVSGNVGAFSRLAFVGLGGSFGTVRLGRQNSQVKELMLKIDPFGSGGMANGIDFVNGGLPERVSNQITWTSNNYSGFDATLGYVFGETPGDSSANRGYGLRIGYANGPLDVQFGYNHQNQNDPAVAAPTDADTKDAVLGATYNFGAFKLHGMFGEKKQDAFDGAPDYKIRSYLIGATVPFGASKIRAEYIRNDNRDLDNADNNIAALSYSYSMSKRTTLYATYAHISNDDNSSMGFGGALDDGALPGQTASGVAVGVQHNF